MKLKKHLQLFSKKNVTTELNFNEISNKISSAQILQEFLINLFLKELKLTHLKF